MFANTKIQDQELFELEEITDSMKQLVLYNDDFNTFDYVTDCLIKVCRHDSIQAEQCTYLVHFAGKCAVKSEHFTKLKPMCDALLERGLTAKIED